MNKYKVCPYCGKHNLPKILECTQCETDLSNVRVIDELLEQRESETEEDKPLMEEVRMVRICDCGTRNPVNSRKCKKCGEDITDIIPVPDKEANEDVLEYMFASLDGEYAYKMVNSKVVIGREADMSDYLFAKSYVSRQHAELTIEEGKLYIQNLSKTNYTYVNNKRISDIKHELYDGDELGLGGNNHNGSRQEEAAYFQIRIGSCM